MKAIFIFDNHNPYLPYRMPLILRALREVSGNERAMLKLILLGQSWGAYKFHVPTDLGAEYGEIEVEALADEFPGRRKLRNVMRMLRSLVRNRPKVVIVQGYDRPECLAALAYARIARCKCICVSNSKFDDSEVTPRRPFKEWVKSLIVRRFDAIGVSGREHARYLEFLSNQRIAAEWPAWNLTDHRVFGVAAEDSRQRRQVRQELGLGPSDRFFFAPTRFNPKKNLVGLVRSYAMFFRGRVGLVVPKLVICGQGAGETELRSEIAELRLQEHVIVASWIPYERLGAAYREAESLILPSFFDQWGNTVNEALASGCPVLVSHGCGARQLVINAYNGFTFDPFNPQSLAELLAIIADDGRLVERMRVNAMASLGQIDEGAFVDCYKRLFCRCVSVSRHRA